MRSRYSATLLAATRLRYFFLPRTLRTTNLRSCLSVLIATSRHRRFLASGRPHARIAHDENEIVRDRAIPGLDGGLRLLDPSPRKGVEFAVLLGRELLPPYLVEGNLVPEDMAFGNMPLAGGKAHDRPKDLHLGADRSVAHAERALGRFLSLFLAFVLLVVFLLAFFLLAFLNFALDLLSPGLLAPRRIVQPSVLPDQRNLDRADIRVELRLDYRPDYPDAVGGDLSRFHAPLLKLNILLGDLAEGVIENGDIVLDAKAHIGVLVEGPLSCRVNVGGFQGNRLVAVLFGEPDPAIPIAVLHIRPAEDHQAGLEFLGIDKEGHRAP